MAVVVVVAVVLVVVVVENSSPAVDPGLYDPWCFMKPKGSITSQNSSDNCV